MKMFLALAVSLLMIAVFSSGCVMTGTHEQILKDERNAANTLLEKTRTDLTKERDDQTAQKEKCQGELKTTVGLKQKIEADLAARGMQIDQLLNEKGALTEERSQLSARQQKLSSQIQELERMRLASEKRSAEYKDLLMKLRKMIDAGTLQVKVRNGRMLVQMSSDVVFPPGGTLIKAEAREAIEELAATIASFPERKFQVVGHSDSKPIHTARFPSNWELSSQRAIEVVKLMTEAGVPPEMISAAGSAEFDPLVDNETPENRSTNRRVEIIFMPKIDELPGFDEVLKK